MRGRWELGDAQWKLIEPILRPQRRLDGRGRPWQDMRAVLNGILWVLGTGAQWRELPKKYPPYQICHRRFQQWVQAGKLERILRVLADELQGRGKVDLEEAFIDASFTGETRQYFDRHASRYDELIETVAFQLDDAYDYLAQYVGGTQLEETPVRILELGIGTGLLTGYLLGANPGAVVTGIDASSGMLERAGQNLEQYRERLSLIHGEFPDAIPDREYDCVVSAIALSFYNIDYAVLFRKVHRVLRPGGLFVYAVNVAQNAASVDHVLTRMLRRNVDITEEQMNWLRSIKGNVKLYQVPSDWHKNALYQGGFADVDCIYLRHKLGIFSGAKPRIAM
jgi:transposase/precorrin-6B methylase 2